LNERAVAVVIDPVQSVKGKVIMDAFRTIPRQSMATGKEPRQTTSNIGLMQRPSLQAIHHGLNKYYYSMVINCRKSDAEQRMLNNLNKVDWSNSLKL
jgi:26S proteasome regulatory subunit N11